MNPHSPDEAAILKRVERYSRLYGVIDIPLRKAGSPDLIAEGGANPESHRQNFQMAITRNYRVAPTLSAQNAQLRENVATWSKVDACPACKSPSLTKN